jgi:dihydroorotate dehydrogenase
MMIISMQKKHEGGLAGAPLLQQSLQVVSTLATLLPEQEIIGVGGIFTGADAMHYWRYGVSGFQCATAFLVYGPKIFSEIFAYLSEPAQ